MNRPTFLPLAVALLLVPNTANALCYYRGELYAKTTLEQEYRDARWVVRAMVLSATGWVGNEARGTLYGLQVVDSFKGSLPRHFVYSTERNSGGFYLDNDGGKPNIGGEYLLFLVPNPRPEVGPQAVRKSLWINYNCGHSRAWREVARPDKTKLRVLSHRS